MSLFIIKLKTISAEQLTGLFLQKLTSIHILRL
jgi:hypothetical protein